MGLIGRVIGFFGGRSHRAMMEDADRARDAGDFREAARRYERVSRRFPNDTGVLVLCGNMLKDAKLYAEAKAVYERALARRPRDADLHLQFGHLTKLQGDWAGAADWYRRSAELDPSRPEAAAELDQLSRRLPAELDDGRRSTILTSAAGSDLVLHRLKVAFAHRPA